MVVSVLKEETIHTFGEGYWPAMEQLVMNESGFNHLAQNPVSTAFGLFQFLDSTWGSYGCQKTTVIAEQVRCGIKYISGRYQNPAKALAFWNQNRWY